MSHNILTSHLKDLLYTHSNSIRKQFLYCQLSTKTTFVHTRCAHENFPALQCTHSITHGFSLIHDINDVHPFVVAISIDI